MSVLTGNVALKGNDVIDAGSLFFNSVGRWWIIIAPVRANRTDIIIRGKGVVFRAGRAQRDRQEMISREIFSVANTASGVFFIVASFPDFFSQF